MTLIHISTHQFWRWLAVSLLLSAQQAQAWPDHALTDAVCSASPLISQSSICSPHPHQLPSSQHGGDDVWEMKISPGKGRGLFAVRDIPKGTHVLIEKPLLVIKPPAFVPGKGYDLSVMAADLEHEYSQLTPEQQEEYLSCHEEKLEGHDEAHSTRLMAILRSNAYNLDDGRVAMFPKVALINHSCQPNVLNADNGGTRVIVATRDIGEGEEILTTYIPLLMDTEARNQRLQQYGFRCDCAACETGASDQRRVQAGNNLKVLKTALQVARTKAKPTQEELLLTAEALAEYVEEEGFADYYVQTSRLAFDFAVLVNEKSRARRWGERHLEHHQMVDGGSRASRRAQKLLDKL